MKKSITLTVVDKGNRLNVYIEIKNKYTGQTTCLCGNSNGDPYDDVTEQIEDLFEACR